MRNSQFNNSKRNASVGMFYFYTFLVFIVLSMLFSCSADQVEEIVKFQGNTNGLTYQFFNK